MLQVAFFGEIFIPIINCYTKSRCSASLPDQYVVHILERKYQLASLIYMYSFTSIFLDFIVANLQSIFFQTFLQNINLYLFLCSKKISIYLYMIQDSLLILIERTFKDKAGSRNLRLMLFQQFSVFQNQYWFLVLKNRKLLEVLKKSEARLVQKNSRLVNKWKHTIVLCNKK